MKKNDKTKAYEKTYVRGKKQKNTLLGFEKKSSDSVISKNRAYDKKISAKFAQQKEQDFGNLLTSDSSLTPIAKVAIMGRPNVGKSSLFNRLNQKNIAITSPISGSTRDINKKSLRLQRFDIELIDTGGLELVAHQLKEFYAGAQNNSVTTKKNTRSYGSINKDSIHKQNQSTPRQQAIIAQHLRESISHHSFQIVNESDIVVYMVDGSHIAIDEDIRIFREISKQKPSILVLNKVDNDKIALQSSEFLSFGVDFLHISVAHNRGITKLLNTLEDTIQQLIDTKKIKNSLRCHNDSEELIPQQLDFMDYFDDSESIIEFNTAENDQLQDAQSQEDASNQEYSSDGATCQKKAYEIAVGIIGRPNVGKSSLLNALTNQNRSLVSSIAGTTIDPVDECITYQGHKITFIDTAGIRRRSKIEGIEKYALDRTQRILKHCDIALLVLDSSEDFVELDEKISSIANNNNLGIIVIFHKWDIRSREFSERMEVYKRKFKFLEYAPVVTISSITRKHIKELKQKIIEVYENFSFRIPTSRLNFCVQNALKKHPIPSDHGKLVRIYYATQFDSKPPKIALIMNRPNALHFSYRRYLVNTLRQEFQFSGVPILIEARSKSQRSITQTDEVDGENDDWV